MKSASSIRTNNKIIFDDKIKKIILPLVTSNYEITQ